MLKEKIKETDQELLERQYKWRNIVFGKDGTTLRGYMTWPTAGRGL